MKRRIHFETIVLICVAISSSAGAADFFADMEAGGYYTSNVYLNDLKEWDAALVPKLNLGIDFADHWFTGYNGELDAFIKHRELLFHKHELYLAANPTWGDNEENGFEARLSAKTQRNMDAYSSVNLVEPTLYLSLSMEPAEWFYWSISEELFYRLFYDDAASDSFDSRTSASVTFTAPSRTTISPRLSVGARLYPRQDKSVSGDTADQQLEAGLHLSQGLWDTGGLQADYAYIHAFGVCGLIERKLTAADFSYVGEEYLFSGHQIDFGFKQVFEIGFSLGFGVNFQTRDYNGWWVLDENGDSTDVERADERLAPYAWVEYGWLPGPNASAAAPEFRTSIKYSYLRQWSNDAWYDTDRSMLEFSLGLGW